MEKVEVGNRLLKARVRAVDVQVSAKITLPRGGGKHPAWVRAPLVGKKRDDGGERERWK